MQGRIRRIQVKPNCNGQSSQRTVVGRQPGRRQRLLFLQAPPQFVDKLLKPTFGRNRGYLIGTELQERGIESRNARVTPIAPRGKRLQKTPHTPAPLHRDARGAPVSGAVIGGSAREPGRQPNHNDHTDGDSDGDRDLPQSLRADQRPGLTFSRGRSGSATSGCGAARP
jgi:hypothetical protein